MTREEAIKRLKEVRTTIQPFEYVNEAIDYVYYGGKYEHLVQLFGFISTDYK